MTLISIVNEGNDLKIYGRATLLQFVLYLNDS